MCCYLQSFGLPSVKVKPEYESNVKIREGPFGVPDPFVAGIGSARPKLGVAHPLEASERNVSFCECITEYFFLSFSTHAGYTIPIHNGIVVLKKTSSLILNTQEEL